MSLQHATFQHNELPALPQSFSSLPNLTYLNLAQNGLTTFPQCLATTPLLTKLVLDRNSITVIPDFVEDMPSLKVSRVWLGVCQHALSRLPFMHWHST